MPLILLLAAAAAPLPPADDTIVVTASREPVAAADSAVPVITLKSQEGLTPSLGVPMVADILRLTPGVAVGVSGPRGSQTQVRIRGSEANHTLLFVDGIRFNDPAAGNEGRFELLAADTFSGIEILRGPHSALWGSEAIGGIVFVDTSEGYVSGGSLDALAEYGSLDSLRASARATVKVGDLNLAGTGSWLRSDGIDSFGPSGERDGFEHGSASLKAVLRPLEGVEVGAVGHWMAGTSEYDGFDPVTFRHADTLDETRNRIAAGRLWGQIERGGWTVKADVSLLSSANRNRLASAPLNSTFGRRFTAGAQVSKKLGAHRLSVAIEHQSEDFRARDQIFFGGTDQDRSRDLVAAVGEWRADWSKALTTFAAIRHDRFSAFRDSTALFAGAVLRPAKRWALTASYGEGIAQPTFYDLYGFFPGSFTGNPALRPERSEGWDASVKWGEDRPLTLSLTAFSNSLRDEIVDVFDPVTFRSTTANATGASRRRGLEAQASWRLGTAARLMLSYTLLDAEERQVAGGLALREVRRPRHSAAFSGHGRIGAFTWGAGLAYVGRRGDTDFDSFPARAVVLDDYLLASARAAWRFSEALEAYARAENAFDARYQDAVGYRTAGRTVYAGLRLRFD